MIPRVVDISHHNSGKFDFAAVAKAGVWGVIHKASQGRSYVDPTYADRRNAVRGAGLLWGAYHFNTGESVTAQVDNFMKAAKPDASTLMVLDFEDNPSSQMSIQQAVEFLRTLEIRLGRKGAIYGGNRIKENVGKLDTSDRAYITSHKLWLCQYGPKAVLPPGWSKYWLWQFTGDGIGPTPHSIAGIPGNGIDINTYDGTREQLTAEWTSRPALPAPPGGGLVASILSLFGKA